MGEAPLYVLHILVFDLPGSSSFHHRRPLEVQTGHAAMGAVSSFGFCMLPTYM